MPSVATLQPENRLQRTLVFRFDCVDLDEGCPWSLANVSPNDQKDLLEHLRQYESKTIGELRGGSFSEFKSYSNFADCPNGAAINRLAKLYDAPDSIARFRLSGTKRLYGFLVDNEFHLLWWDPNHEVCPVGNAIPEISRTAGDLLATADHNLERHWRFPALGWKPIGGFQLRAAFGTSMREQSMPSSKIRYSPQRRRQEGDAAGRETSGQG